jgi:hypothetical protein
MQDKEVVEKQPQNSFRELSEGFGRGYIAILESLVSPNIPFEQKQRMLATQLVHLPAELRRFVDPALKAVTEVMKRNITLLNLANEGKVSPEGSEKQHEFILRLFLDGRNIQEDKIDRQTLLNELKKMTTLEVLVPGIVNLHITSQAKDLLDRFTDYRKEKLVGEHVDIAFNLKETIHFSYLVSYERDDLSVSEVAVAAKKAQMHEVAHFLYSCFEATGFLRSSTEETPELQEDFLLARNELCSYLISASVESNLVFPNLDVSHLFPKGVVSSAKATETLKHIVLTLGMIETVLRDQGQRTEMSILLYPVMTAQSFTDIMKRISDLGNFYAASIPPLREMPTQEKASPKGLSLTGKMFIPSMNKDKSDSLSRGAGQQFSFGLKPRKKE